MVNCDFSDLCAALNDVDARYLLVGAHLPAFHAEPRCAKDLDASVEATPDHARRVLAALRAFGASIACASEGDVAQPGVMLQIGVVPNRIDLATQVDGLAFADAWPNRIESGPFR